MSEIKLLHISVLSHRKFNCHEKQTKPIKLLMRIKTKRDTTFAATPTIIFCLKHICVQFELMQITYRADYEG